MDLISEISSFNNPFDNTITNTIDSINKNLSKNNIDSNIKTNDFVKQFELDKIKDDNMKKYNDIKINLDLLQEVIDELEKKSTYILESINYVQNIHKESLRLFTQISR